MSKSMKPFIFTFIVAPSILGLGLTLSVEVIPFIWSIITQQGTDLDFKNVVLSFLLGYAMYLVYIIYKAIVHKFNKNRD